MTTKKKSQETALAVSDFTALSMIKDSGGDLMETIHDFLAGGELRIQHLQRGVVPTGGNIMWMVKAGKGRPTAVETIEGVIIEAKRSRAWYKVPYEESGGGSPPDCISLDMRKGVALTEHGPGTDCATCPFNQWGSSSRKGGSGRGKACGERIWLFLLRQDHLLPMLINAPTTSLESIDQYLMSILDSGIMQYWRVMTKLTLEQGNNGAVDYAWIQAENMGPVSEELFAEIQGYRNTFRPIIQASMESLARRSDGADVIDGTATYVDPETGEILDVDPETGEMRPSSPEDPSIIDVEAVKEPVAAGAGAEGSQDELPF